MLCDTPRFDLKALLDGELGPVAAWRLRCHLRRCPACTKEYEAMQTFHALLRAADIVTPDPAPALHAPLVPRRTPTAWKLAGGALAMAALMLLLFVLPTVRRSPQSMSAAVASALAQVNTWHLSGWKQINGKRVPWDVWGRRVPFLFYEKVGDDITFDDGAQRLRLYPPAPALHRPTGLVIRTASDRPATGTQTYAYEPAAENMVDQWDWKMGGGMFAPQPFRQTPTEAVFRQQYPQGVQAGVNSNLLYTISKLTNLPVSYRLRYSTVRSHYDTEGLQAVYSVALPPAVTAPPIPAPYSRVDLTNPTTATVSVQASAVALDGGGNVLMRYRCRLGGLLLTPASTFSASVSETHFDGLRNGKPIRYIDSTNMGMGDANAAGDVYNFYSPLEPIRSAANLPEQMKVTLDVTPRIQVAQSDYLRLTNHIAQIGIQSADFASQTGDDRLPTTSAGQTVTLPPVPNTRSVVQAAPRELGWVFRRTPLAVQVDRGRVNYYRMSTDDQNEVFKQVAPELVQEGILNADGSINVTRPIPVQRLEALHNRYKAQFNAAQYQQHLQAIYWQKQLIADEPGVGSTGGDRIYDTQWLAKLYQEVGNQAQMRRYLRLVIEEYQAMPQHGGLPGRQAEYALRTGQFPADANYKGPS